MEQTTPSTTIQIRQDSNESGPYISNILHDYDDDETVTKKLANYGYANNDVDVKPAAAICNSNQGDNNQDADQEVVTTSPSILTATSTEVPLDSIDMADAIREFALLKVESRALRNEIVRLQTELPRDLEVNSRRVTQDLESQVAAVISSQFQLSESQLTTRATISTSGEGDQDTIVTDAAIRGESAQEVQVEAALPEASPVVQAISATLVNSIHEVDDNEPVYDAQRVSYDGDETMKHHCQRIMKQNRKKLIGTGLILLLAVVLVVLGVGGAFTSESQPMVVIPVANTANPSISHVPTVSSAPSSTQTPSIQPSTSISPTETCYWIDILIDYDDDPHETSFELWRRDVGSGSTSGTRDEVLIYKGAGSHGDTFYKKSLCLLEGEYEYIMKDIAGDGICCGVTQGDGHYTVTTNETLIAEGGEFNRKETSLFMIPYVGDQPTTTEGYYVDWDDWDWMTGTCTNNYPKPDNGAPLHETKEECCARHYIGQSSHACMCWADPCYSCKCNGAAESCPVLACGK